MKKKWMLRLTALCAAALLSVSALSESPTPTATPETFATAAPANEDAVVAMEVDTTATPDPTAMANATATPAPTATAVVTATPDPTATADATATPDPTATADATATPDPTATADATATPDPTATPEVKVIASVAPLAQSEYIVSQKPDLGQALAMLPAALEVTLQNGAAESLPVTWNCDHYETETSEYTFTPSLAAEGYALADGVSLPTARFRIEAPAELVSGDFTLTIGADGALTVTAFQGDADTIVVPAEAEGRKVVRIAATTFAGNETLREITVPAGAISIETGAFEGCKALEKISLPDSLEQVGGDLFKGCDALEFIQLNISEEIVMTGAQGYTREIIEVIDNVEQKRTVSVTLEPGFTDFCVLNGGHWHVEGALLVDKEHAATVSSSGSMTVSETGSLTVLGSLSCAGTAVNIGKVVACAGTVTGVDGVIGDHSWSADGVCTVCGEVQTILLDVNVLRERFERTYDGTSGLDISAEDFELVGVREGDDVSIAAINVGFNKKDAGSYLTNVSFVLAGESAGRYAVKQVEIGVTIHPKKVTVTPRAGQSKVYGEKDPTISAGYKGTVKGEALQGALSREKGESAGKYKILSGTLDRLNPNYEIVLGEAWFEIKAKDISGSSVKVARISNQRYTGSELEPDVEIHDGSTLLKAGTDYTLTYEDNTSVGTASVIITGKGNYTGSRKATFKIIKVSSGSSDSSLSASSSGSSANLSDLNDFGGTEEAAQTEADASTLVLTVDGAECGNLIFDELDQPRAFLQSERLLENNGETHRILTISVEDISDEDGVLLPGEYGKPRMKLTMDTIYQLREAGYAYVELIVGEAETLIPLDTLYAEFVSVDGTLSVEIYEVRLWLLSDEDLTPQELSAMEGYTLSMKPVHFELLATPLAEAEPSEGEAAEPMDVLSLLDGVQMMFVPETVVDYEGTVYWVLSISLEDPDMQYEPAGATFILDGGKVKSNLNPLFGGTYALAEKME